MSRSQRRAMIDREEPNLSLVRQCALLGISRSSLYFSVVSAITDPDKPKSERFTQFIVEFDNPGFTREAYQPTMGRYGLKSWELSLQDCFVPEENVLAARPRII